MALKGLSGLQIVGYTDLMAKDRDKTMELLRLNKEIQNPLVESHQGRLLKELGNGTMSTFQTASDAIDCALALQKQTAEVENLTLRIGIHLGEVLIEENDAFGDGVNIASRIQSIQTLVVSIYLAYVFFQETIYAGIWKIKA